jgi:mRNA interferase HigB
LPHVHVISRKALREFWEVHPDAELPLRQWEAIVKRADWQDWADLKSTYGSADKVEKHVVFNVGGNKYRLIAMVSYAKRKVYIQRVLTHKEYDGGTCKDD